MNKKIVSTSLAVIAGLLVVVAVFLVAFQYFHGLHITILDPQGLIAEKERNLLVLITALSMIVIVPVFVLTIFVAWKYREGNEGAARKAKYNPDRDNGILVETIWWGVPTILIIIFSVIIWTSSQDLDPYKPIPASTAMTDGTNGSPSSPNAPITVQVIAMDWKWLFIYPAQHIATVNFLEFPENTPVNFEITSDAPMNSFWIPALGSQIYAMPSMSTELHLIASSTGMYYGSSANISGSGFAGMAFTARSVSQSDFENWVAAVGQASSSNELTPDTYNSLAQPSSDVQVTYYSYDPSSGSGSGETGVSGGSSLYDKVLMKDMMQASEVATDTDAAMNADMNMGSMGGMMMTATSTGTRSAMDMDTMSNASGSLMIMQMQ